MPDHVHALLAFPGTPGMSVVIRNWKRGAARLQGVLWQDNYFDHRIRSKAEAQEKGLYIRRNPVVKGLCGKVEDWPHWWGVTRSAC
jgi:putative transposase